MSVPTFLVTGSAGYIGSVLVGKLLASGSKVIGLDSLLYDNFQAVLPYLGHPRFRFVRGDVRDRTVVSPLLRTADIIIPLAALVGAPLCDQKSVEAVQVNEEAIRFIATNASRDQRLIYPNTDSGYGHTDGQHALTEKDPLHPISVYGVTKCAGEKDVLDHVNAVSLRLSTVFGSSPRLRMDLLVNDFTRRLLQEGQLSIFEPHFLRSFVGVQDVASAFLFMAQNPVHHGAFNLRAPGGNITKMELAYLVCEVIGVSKEVVTVGAGEDPDKRCYRVANDKILATGFEFRQALADGVREISQVVRYLPYSELKKARNV